MKRISILVALFMTLSLSAQEAKGKEQEFVEAVYKEHIELRLSHLKEALKEKNDHLNFEEIYKDISKIYAEQFTSSELTQLLSFYKSPLGKKILKSQENLKRQADAVITDWEMKKLGIEIHEDPMTDEKYLKMVDSIKIAEEKMMKKRIKTDELPDINSLKDLKALLLKNPTAMSDSRLLQKILGDDVDVDKVFMEFHKKQDNENGKE